MAKPLTPEEEDQIKKYWLEGDTVLEIEAKTGRSHTRINKITRNIPRSSRRSHRQFTTVGTNTEISTRPQVPLPQKKIYIPPPSGFYHPYQTPNYSKPNQDQNPSTWTPMDSPSMTYDQNPENKEMDRRLQEIQRVIEQLDRSLEEWKAIENRVTEWNDTLRKQQNERSRKQHEQEDQSLLILYKDIKERQQEKINYLKESINVLQSRHEKLKGTPLTQETKQPSTMTRVSPTEAENSTIASKEIPEKEKPTQTSAENKPSPICKPSITPQDSQPQDFTVVSKDDTQLNHLELKKRLSLYDTTLICGFIKGISSVITQILSNIKQQKE